MAEKLLAEHPDMQGLFISGGGITGALAAFRDSDRAEATVAVGYELMDETKSGLLDGILTLVISHSLELLARETIAAMIRSNFPMRAVQASASRCHSKFIHRTIHDIISLVQTNKP